MFTENIRMLRTERNQSQQDIADYLQVSRQVYSNYENGKREPDYETVLKLAAFFDMTTDCLMCEENEEQEL